MPYDRNGKYYRQPVYNENFILNKTKKSDSEVKSDNKKSDSEVRSDNKNISPEAGESPLRTLTNILKGMASSVLIMFGLGFIVFALSTPRTRKTNYDKAPSVEKTLDNMLQYQKEKDARRRSEQIIDNFMFKQMNSW